MLGVKGYQAQTCCVLVLTSPKARRIVHSVTSRPWGISGGHALGPLASPNNQVHRPPQRHTRRTSKRLESTRIGDELRRRSLRNGQKCSRRRRRSPQER